MASFIVLCLIMANPLLISAMAADNEVIAEAPTARKLGKHDYGSKIATPQPSPTPGPVAEASGVGESGGGAEEELMESNHSLQHHHHHSFEKSVIGGVAVVGVLAAVFLAAVFCYIRATRRRPVPVQPGSPTDSSSSDRKMVESVSRDRVK